MEQQKKDAIAIANDNAGVKMSAAKFQSLQTSVKQKNMSQALEQLVQESRNRADPIFTRGAEIEVTTMQDVEMLKAHLASIKIHIPTKSIQRGIIMPRDQETNGEYPDQQGFLMHNPWPTDRTAGGKKKAKGKKKKGAAVAVVKKVDDGTTQNRKLEPNEKLEYKPFEFANFPLLQNGKPKGGTFRLRLPSEADWKPAKKKLTEEEKAELEKQ